MTKTKIQNPEADRNNFPSPLHLVCGKDEYRKVFQYVVFTNGYAYVSDAHCLIRQRFDFIGIEGVENLEGKCLHKDVFKAIYQKKDNVVVKALPDCIEVLDYKSSFLVKYDYQEPSDQIPDYQKILNDINQIPEINYHQIAFTDKILTKLLKAMAISDTGRFIIHLPNVNTKAVVITSPENDWDKTHQLGLIMPVMIP